MSLQTKGARFYGPQRIIISNNFKWVEKQ